MVRAFESYQKPQSQLDLCSHDLCKWEALLVVVVNMRIETLKPILIRAPYRRFANHQRIRIGSNPARPGSDRYNRFETYNTAAAIREMRRLGGTSQDISLDISKGALTFLQGKWQLEN